MAAYTRKQYSGAARNTTTTTLLTNVGTTVDIAATTGWPSIAGIPFYVVISPSSLYEEKCLATISGSTLTLDRAKDDTTASEHPIGSVIYPVFTANDADEANELVSKLTTTGDLLTTDGTNLLRLGVGEDGYFLKASSSASAGIEWASIPTINSLDDVGDVTITTVEDGDFLTYNSSASAWVNETIHFITVSDTEPADEVSEGDLWYNSSELELYTYYSNNWVQVTLTPEFLTVEELDNVYIDTANAGDVLAFDGLDWYNDTVSNLFGSHIIALSGDVSGSAVFDGSASVTIPTTIQIDSITLGTDTHGDYVSSLVAGTGIALTNNSGESATPTVALNATLDNLSNVTVPSPTSGDFLKWNGTAWVNDAIDLGTDTTGNYMSDLTQGTGVTITHTPSEGSNATIAIGQAVGTSASVTFANVNTTGDVVVGGNLTVNGTTTTLNTETLAVEDNIVVLNSNVSASPLTNAGIEVERGTSDNVSLRWNESTDKWEITNDGSTYGDIATETYVVDLTSTLDNIGDVSLTQPYSIGDTGPAGGKIFITPDTAGNSTGMYFEAAPTASQVQRSWATGGNQSSAVPGAAGTAIGTGAQNTVDIVAQSGNLAATSAARYASDYEYNNFSDWFLPSIDELQELYDNKTSVGGLLSSNYWSSTEYSATQAEYENLGDGGQAFAGKNLSLYVRPVRAFLLNAGEFLKYDGSSWVNDTINLGTDTTGNYMSDLTQGTGVTITHTPGEGSNATIAIGQDVSTSSSVTFSNVTADLVGDVTGNADTATALETARTIELSGDVSGSASFDGTANINLFTTVNTASVAIGELYGVNITSPEEFQTLEYDGTEWVNQYASVVSYVRNAEATTITAGTPVYLFGGNGDHASVKRADNTTDATSSKTVGLAGANIAASENGPVITRGYVDGVNLSMYVAGDVLWLGKNGQVTTTKPSAPDHLVFIGVVVRATNNGIMYVAAQNGYELEELHDVKISSPLDGQFLRYNSASVVWVNDTINLGTDTAGDYVQNLTAGTGVTLSNNSGEGSTPTVAIGQDVATSASVTFARLIVQGDMEVQGTITRLNETNLDVDTAFIYLNANSASANPDMGIAFNYDDGTYRHAGLFRDSSDGIFKVFEGYEPEPVSPINTSDATYSDARFQAESLILTQTTGTAPMSVSSSTVVTNLNADKLDGQDGSYYAPIDSPIFTGTVSLPNNTVALGTQTTGNYVSDVSGGTGISVSHTPGEGSTATISTTGVQTLGAKAGNYTLAAGDAAETIIIMDSSSANDLTVPSASAVAFGTGTSITVIQRGTGKTRILAGAGVTLLATPGLFLRARYSSCTLVKTENANEWFVIGDLAAS